MSSPYEPGTKRGTEETLQAISKTVEWAVRIPENELKDTDVDEFINQLQEEEIELREKYRMKTTEVEVENFVVNQEDRVEDILTGDLDDLVRELENLDAYIAEAFGYEEPFSFSKEERIWLVAQEVKRRRDSMHSPDVYREGEIESLALDDMGSVPEQWGGGDFPKYN